MMKELGNLGLEYGGAMLNDLDNRLPKSRGACFDIGTSGGCGVTCAEFCRGGCDEPQEIDKQDVIDEHGEDAMYILEFYHCYDD